MKIHWYQPIERAIRIIDIEISDKELDQLEVTRDHITNITECKNSMQLDFLSMLARQLEEINEMGKTSKDRS